MDAESLLNVFVFLVAACAVVPFASKFKLGSVLGYLIAGVIIGPFVLGLIDNPQEIMHFAEFGVVMMLFVIGLELEPSQLWRLRKAIVGLGGLQVVATSAVLTAIGMALGFEWRVSLTGGMALSLSSTALVFQILEEKGLLQTSAGESSFAVLLFQDIAVIPILILLPLLAEGRGGAAENANLLSGIPGWLHALCVCAVIGGIVVMGRYLSRYVFRFVAKSNLREVFTATSLALVVGITLLMQAIGVSPALGAFIAGVVLANSEYKRTLETDLQPFKGLLLGLFFISVGMGMNFHLMASKPMALLIAFVLVMGVKALILFFAGRIFGLRDGQNLTFAFALCQGGEFAFVLFQYASGMHLFTEKQSAFATLFVALSMAATPLLMLVNDRYVTSRYMSRLKTREFDEIAESNPVIIAGYGRFGQIIGRFLRAQGIDVTVLEKDPDQVDQIRRFGGLAYFGDASRLDLLRSAGADKARLIAVCVDDADKCLEITKLVKEEFPKVKIFARARNRRHAYELNKAGADYFKRETFDSSLAMAQEVMIALGNDPDAMSRKALAFRQHDEETLRNSFEFFGREPDLIAFARQAAGELEQILRDDRLQT